MRYLLHSQIWKQVDEKGDTASNTCVHKIEKSTPSNLILTYMHCFLPRGLRQYLKWPDGPLDQVEFFLPLCHILGPSPSVWISVWPSLVFVQQPSQVLLLVTKWSFAGSVTTCFSSVFPLCTWDQHKKTKEKPRSATNQYL